MWMLPRASLVALCSRAADNPPRNVSDTAEIGSDAGQPCKTTEMGSRTGEPWEAESSDRTSATTAEVGWSDDGKKEMRKCIPLTIEEKRKQVAKQLRDIKDLRNDCDMITADAKWFKQAWKKCMMNVMIRPAL